MAKDKCLLRLEDLLSKSSLNAVRKDEIVSAIKEAKARRGLSRIDDIDVDSVAKEVSEQIKLQKLINKRNALEDEIKIRNAVDFIFEDFANDPAEGLIAYSVGSNLIAKGAKSSVAAHQHAVVGQLVGAWETKLKELGLEEIFTKGLDDIAEPELQLRITKVIEQLSKKTEMEQRSGLQGVVDGETNPKIIKLAEAMEEFSELIRNKLNDRGANIGKIWGYIIRQSHDPYLVRDAAKVLGLNLDDIKVDPSLQKFKKDINYNKNYTAWKNYVLPKLDKDRTFAEVDDVDEFMLSVYNTLVGNKYLLSDGSQYAFGAKLADNKADKSKMKRVLHFKNGTEWFEYNNNFGVGNLKESFLSGLQTAGRNIGIMERLGTKPSQNFDKIRYAVQKRMEQQGRDTTSVARGEKFDKFIKVIDGSIYTTGSFNGARYSAIARALASMASLGGATISAAADIGIFASEMRHQGKSFLSGLKDAFVALSTIKNSEQRKQLAKIYGLMTDNTIYDVSARHQVGDNLSKGWTNVQRFFFKVNLLSWWTNTLKQSAMLGMSHYYALQRGLNFNQLNKPLQSLFKTYDIDSVKWDIIRKQGMEKVEDGTEFLNIEKLDQISDADIKKIVGIEDLSKRELKIEKEKFKASISAMLLDRTTTAVIEPDARVKGEMTRSTIAGTLGGEAIRFLGQFKAFPISIVQRVVGRELGVRKVDKLRGNVGLVTMLASSVAFGYMSMTIKDLLKGRSPRELNYRTMLDAMLQGGGLGIYGDLIFRETRTAMEKAGVILGPVPSTALELLQAITYGVTGEGKLAARSTYRAIKQNIPFLNLFYIKTGFDYLFGYTIQELLSPGSLKRIEKDLKKEYDQDFIFPKPSSYVNRF